jgi:AcrR family transcriptional regulator
MTTSGTQNQPQKGAASSKRAIREIRRRELLSALPRAIARIGPGASMEELANEVGITKPVLYKHFGSRAGLAEALTEQYLEDFHREVTAALQNVPNARAFVRTLLNSYFGFVERQRAFVAFIAVDLDPRELAEGSRTSVARRALSSGLARVLEAALRTRGLDTSPAESWGLSLQLMIEGTAFTWLRDGGSTREQVVEHLFSLIWNGVGGVLDRRDEKPAVSEDPGDST